jgi:hypothetical protein
MLTSPKPLRAFVNWLARRSSVNGEERDAIMRLPQDEMRLTAGQDLMTVGQLSGEAWLGRVDEFDQA